MAIRYTKHAQEKFAVLARHGFIVLLEQVADAGLNPDTVVPHSSDQFIAQKRITERHVLRVVLRREGADQVVIAFYPGWRTQYENDL